MKTRNIKIVMNRRKIKERSHRSRSKKKNWGIFEKADRWYCSWVYFNARYLMSDCPNVRFGCNRKSVPEKNREQTGQSALGCWTARSADLRKTEKNKKNSNLELAFSVILPPRVIFSVWPWNNFANIFKKLLKSIDKAVKINS